MAQALLEMEGIWEEIAAHAPEFSRHRLRVGILPEISVQQDPRLDFLQEIEERSRSMNPKPDVHDLLREGREGAMYGVPLISANGICKAR